MKIAILGGKLVDGTGAGAKHANILIDADRIASILPPESPLPPLDREIDAHGLTVISGLIDAHDHQTFHNTFGPLPQQWRLSREQLMIRSCVAACDALRHGITTIREMGAPHASNLSMKRAVARGDMVGPRIITCGMPLAVIGGHAYEICLEVGGTTGVRDAVRAQLKNGADFVKLMASNEQPMAAAKEQTVPQFTPEEIHAAVEEARDAGVRVAVHVCGTKAIERCLEAGVDAIEHGIYLNRDLAQRMKEQGVYYTPTIGIYHENGKTRWLRGAGKAALCRLLVEAHIPSVRHAIEAGVKITVGTDAIVPLAVEMQHLVDSGLTHAQVLQAATRGNSELLGCASDLGTIEPGKLADLILVEGDPERDFTSLARVKLILQNGVGFEPAQLLPMLPMAEPPPTEDNIR